MGQEIKFQAEGTKVQGEYCGVKYSGQIASNRFNTAGKCIEFTIKLDAPISVYGQNRDVIHIGGFATESNTMEAC